VSPAVGRCRYYGEWLPIAIRSRLHPDTYANRRRTIEHATKASPAMLLFRQHRNEQQHWTSSSTPLLLPERHAPDLAPCSATLPTDGVHPKGRNNTGPAKHALWSGVVRSSTTQTDRVSPSGRVPVTLSKVPVPSDNKSRCWFIKGPLWGNPSQRLDDNLAGHQVVVTQDCCGVDPPASAQPGVGIRSVSNLEVQVRCGRTGISSVPGSADHFASTDNLSLGH
jgi:hypothetical protein